MSRSFEEWWSGAKEGELKKRGDVAPKKKAQAYGLGALGTGTAAAGGAYTGVHLASGNYKKAAVAGGASLGAALLANEGSKAIWQSDSKAPVFKSGHAEVGGRHNERGISAKKAHMAYYMRHTAHGVQKVKYTYPDQ